MITLSRPPWIYKNLFRGMEWRKDPSEKKIYLTFDDGPVQIYTPFVLDTLKEEKIKATFFCVGENISVHPEIFSRIISEGHSIGNHTYNHLNAWKTSTRDYLRNIERSQVLFESVLFRPPYGKIDFDKFRSVRKNFRIIMWDVLTRDYDKKISPETCLKIALNNSRNGSIVVFHDSEKAWGNLRFALPIYIREMKKLGFSFGKL